MDRMIRKLKKEMSAGGDDIVNRVWKYGGKRSEGMAMGDM